MNPNDPNNPSQTTGSASPPSDSNAPKPEELTPEALYGPSTPGVDAPAAPGASAVPPPTGDVGSTLPGASTDLSASGAMDSTTPPTELQTPSELPPSSNDFMGGTGGPTNTQPQMLAEPQSPYADQGMGPSSATPEDTFSQAPQDTMATSQDMGSPADDMQGMPPAENPAPETSTFYQQVPEIPLGQSYDQAPAPPAEPAPYEPYQPEVTQEQEPLPAETPPPPPGLPLPPEQPAAGNLPPIPKRSKLPLILIGVALVLLVSAAGAYFILVKGGGSKTPAPSPTEEPVTCDVDPENPNCTGPTAVPSEAPTVSPVSSGTFTIPPGNSPSTSATPASTTKACQLLGTCP